MRRKTAKNKMMKNLKEMYRIQRRKKNMSGKNLRISMRNLGRFLPIWITLGKSPIGIKELQHMILRNRVRFYIDNQLEWMRLALQREEDLDKFLYSEGWHLTTDDKKEGVIIH